ncbi:MAG: fumarate reductase flavoprotein subunit [Gammaproteobacteria bacterium]|nr:fumarate reductase flavoprotein subunit [Gammaproteobacteria bacterium]
MDAILNTDVLVIGGGLAGERCAIEAANAGQDVIIASLIPPRRSHSCAAQGGMQAALGNCAMGDGDNPNVHFLDTVRGSDWGADQEVVRMFVDEAPAAVRELAYFGVPWTRVTAGTQTHFIKGRKVELTESEENAGLLMQRDFGGTAKWRTCYAAAGTGHAALYAIDGEVVRLGITVRDRVEALSLIHDQGRCHGAVVRCLRTGKIGVIIAKATVIATGGHGRIYGKYTTNATINEGTGTAMALATGVVPLGNMEAVQFHPTGLWPSGILVTEGCRGDGGYLLNRKLQRFMVDLEPEKQELASRDVVSRHMMTQIREGLGVDGPFGTHLWLDIRHLGREHVHTKLREVYEICQDFLGLDPADELIPVRPTQHYSMGGVRVNKDGQAYGMSGLFAAGEAACWDMHGFNRLGGNSLAETIVAGRIVGARAAQFAGGKTDGPDPALVEHSVREQQEVIADWLARSGNGPTVYEIRDRLAETMMGKVGIFRNGEELEEAVTDIYDLIQACDTAVLRSKVPGMNPELAFALRLPGMLRLALVTAQGALARTESRGAHSRTDYAARDDARWLKRTLARWPHGATAPVFDYEPVGLLDLPPAGRGYGKSSIIEMSEELADYNETVSEEQQRHGRLDSDSPFGANLRAGEWRKATGEVS